MKKALFFFAILALSLSFGVVSYAQSIKIGVGGGLTKSTKTENLLGDAASGELKLGSDYHYGVKAKVGIPLFPLTLTASYFYNSLNTDNNIGGVDYKYSSSFSTLGIGGELGFIPGPVSPYLALDLNYVTFGDSKLTIGGIENPAVGGNSRFGLGLGAGIDIGIIPKFDFDIMAKYQMNNLIGKEDGEESSNTFNLTVLVMFGIL